MAKSWAAFIKVRAELGPFKGKEFSYQSCENVWFCFCCYYCCCCWHCYYYYYIGILYYGNSAVSIDCWGNIYHGHCTSYWPRMKTPQMFLCVASFKTNSFLVMILLFGNDNDIWKWYFKIVIIPQIYLDFIGYPQKEKTCLKTLNSSYLSWRLQWLHLHTTVTSPILHRLRNP